MPAAPAAGDVRAVLVGVTPAVAPPARSTGRDTHLCPARYAGTLPDRHVAAVARTALLARGFRPPLDRLVTSLTLEAGRRAELTDTVLPARFPDLFAAWRDCAPPMRARLPEMLVLGEQQALALLAVAGDGAASDDAAEVGLLGGLFNAVISVLDHLDDCGDAGLRRLLRPRTLRWVLGDADDSSAALDGLRRRCGADPTARTAVELMAAWTALARRVRTRSGNAAAWAALRSSLLQLLGAQHAVNEATGSGQVRHAEALLASTRLKSQGPSTAIAAMVALARRPADPPPPALWSAARRLGRVFCLADDTADLAEDARAGRPNVHLLAAGPEAGKLTDLEAYAAIDAAAAELAEVLRPTADPEVDHYAAEVVTRWLRWDEHERRIPRGARPVTAPSPALQRALDVLLRSHAAGYDGASHELTFPRGRVGVERLETHSGELFVRAVVMEALLDAYDAGLPVDAALLCAEGVRLLRAKHPHVRGGWSYLASVPELPPDADDLAQVLRVLARLGGRPLAAACDEPVRLALDGADGSGGFPTWIVDARQGGALDAAMAAYVDVVGGGGVHPDVVANLAEALALVDSTRYGRAVARAAAYLAGVQQPDGSWSSAWYAGPYYGTYRACAVLAPTRGWPEQCGHGARFLLDTQHAHGGWGSGQEESLSTAFGVLTLSLLDPGRYADAVAAGVVRLRATQERGGGWPPGAWIAFPTRGGPVAHRSAATTTAYVLRALLAAESVLRPPARRLP